MTDIAQILGVSGPKPSNATGDGPPPLPANHQPSRAMKLQGMPREVMGLLSGSQDAQSAELPPVVPSFNPEAAGGKRTASTASNGREKGSVKIGAKWISIKKPARQWTWAPFSSSSRTDGALFHHWVRANVEYPDYPYARFDIHLDPITYSEEEYRRYLTNDLWTKSETDQLLELSRRFELRWPVIYDRWVEMFYSPKDAGSEDMRKIEDLQHRYYSVAALLTQSRIAQEAAAEAQTLASSTPEPSDDPKAAAEELIMETAAARALASSDPQHQPLMNNLGAGISNKVYDLEQERERRSHMEILWNRTKEEEVEEAELRKELKHVEAQLRKVKKSGGHILAAANGLGGAAGSGMLNSASSSRNTSRAATPVPGGAEMSPALLDEAFASTAPTPMPQTPYLQSGRLAPPNTGGSAGLNKTLLTRMDAVLEELKVPKRVIPTKRVCDMYDTVRKDILTLLILQKNVLQKEGLVQSKRLKLAKMGGNVRVVDEETLLGIAPPPAASAASGASAANRGKGSRPGGKSKTAAGSGGGGGKAKSTHKAKSGDDTNKTGTDLKKTGTEPKKTGTDLKKTGTDLKEALGGKAARKSGGKRKKKPDSKPPQAPPSSTGATSTATATSSAATPAVAAAPAAAAKSTETGDGKQSAKKRARKNNPST